ncbi:MAG: hypothetical protein WCQ00_01040 [bacterium]
MSDELDDTIKAGGDDTEADTDDDKEITDINPAELSGDDAEDPVEEEAAVSPEEDPFGFGAFGELNEDGEYVAPTTDDEDEVEDEISEDLF